MSKEAPHRYDLEDFKRELTIDPEKIRLALEQTDEQQQAYRDEINRMLTGGWKKQKRIEDVKLEE